MALSFCLFGLKLNPVPLRSFPDHPMENSHPAMPDLITLSQCSAWYLLLVDRASFILSPVSPALKQSPADSVTEIFAK